MACHHAFRAVATALALVCAPAAGALAGSPQGVLPEPPEAPEWIEPSLLAHRLEVTTRACEESEPATPGWSTSWSKQHELRLLGVVHHNGSDRLDRKNVSAWQVGDRLVVAYELTSDPFPEAPVMACGAWTRVEIVFPPLAVRPKEVSLYQRRLTDGPRESLAIPP